MATPINGTLKIAVLGGQPVPISFYLSDVTLEPLRFAKDGKATTTSPDYLLNNTGRPWAIEDICTVGAPATITTYIVKIDDIAAGILLAANHISTIASRPVPGTYIMPGKKLTIVQVT